MDFGFLAEFVQNARWVLPMVPMAAFLLLLTLAFGLGRQ